MDLLIEQYKELLLDIVYVRSEIDSKDRASISHIVRAEHLKDMMDEIYTHMVILGIKKTQDDLDRVLISAMYTKI